MATLELCDLCGGKVKTSFTNLSMRGRLQVYKGNPPPPPEGFRYQEENERGKTFVKVWDNYGKVITQFNLMPKPPKWRHIEVGYDLCESCAQRLMMLLEELRSKYHLEQKEIKFLDKPYKYNPFRLLLGEDPMDDDEEDEE